MIRQTIIHSTVLSAIVALSASSAIAANNSIVFDSDSEQKFDSSVLIVPNYTHAQNPNKYAGVSVTGGFEATLTSPDININADFSSDSYTKTDEVSMVQIGNADANLTIKSNISGIGVAHRVTGFFINSKSDLTVNGNVSFDLTAVNTDSSSIPRTSIGFRLQNDANVNVNSDSVDITLKGGDLRGFYVENSELNISANDIYVKSTINEEKAGYNQGVYLTQGSLTLNGSSATFVLEGSNVQQKALNLVADQTGSTLLNINTESLNLQVTGSGNESYGIVASATTGIVNISSKSIIANISDNVAYGLYAQYGARVSQTNPEALLDISVRGREEAVGIMNSTYGGSGTFQYGSINITGDTKISVEAEGTAIGIANQIYPGDTIDIISPADGINLQGQNWVTVVSTSAEGQAIGVLADNTQYDPDGLVPTSSTKISNLNVSATGENGAKSFGIYGAENSKLELSGTTIVTAKGEDAIGMTLENAQIAITGEALITGDSNGITVNENSILNINDAGHITTNTMKSEGTTNLDSDSILTVTGGKDTSSSLGTINADNATIELGAGSYDINSLTGDHNSLVLTDLSTPNRLKLQLNLAISL